MCRGLPDRWTAEPLDSVLRQKPSWAYIKLCVGWHWGLCAHSWHRSPVSSRLCKGDGASRPAARRETLAGAQPCGVWRCWCSQDEQETAGVGAGSQGSKHCFSLALPHLEKPRPAASVACARPLDFLSDIPSALLPWLFYASDPCPVTPALWPGDSVCFSVPPKACGCHVLTLPTSFFLK